MKQIWVWMGVAALALVGVVVVVDSNSTESPPQPVELSGTYQMFHRDNFESGESLPPVYVVETNKELIPVANIEAPRAIGKNVHLKGHYVETKKGKVFRASEAEFVPSSATSVVSSGVKTVAVILLNFSNDRTTPATSTQLRDAVFDTTTSSNAYYKEASNNQVSLTGDVLGWYPINSDNSACNLSTWRNAANTAATAAGVNLASYQYKIYAWPYTSSCGFAGAASMPGSELYINGSFFPGTISHELGHNFGMNHAQALTCMSGTTKVALSDNCTTAEYGDPFENMGGGYNSMLSNWHLAEMGWRSGSNIQTITSSGTYTITPLADTTGPCLLRVAHGGSYLNLEFRQPDPPFENYTLDYPVSKGVLIRLAPDPNGPIKPTQLVDTTPDTATWWDSPLLVGQTFNDNVGATASNVAITTLSVSPTGATVSIQFNGAPPPTTVPPTTTPPTTTPPTTIPPPPTTLPPGALIEKYDTGDDHNSDGAWASFKLGQTFTAESTHPITQVEVKVFRKGNVTVTCELYAAPNGIPTGNVLASSTVENVATVAQWSLCKLPTSPLVTQGLKYAIVLRASGGNSSNAVYWRNDSTGPTYTGGSYLRSRSSGAWDATTVNLTRDALFRIYS